MKEGICVECKETKEILAKGKCRKCYWTMKNEERKKAKAEKKRTGEDKPKRKYTRRKKTRKVKRKYTKRHSANSPLLKGFGQEIGRILIAYRKRLLLILRNALKDRDREIADLKARSKTLRLNLLKERGAILKEVEKKAREMENVLNAEVRVIEARGRTQKKKEGDES